MKNKMLPEIFIPNACLVVGLVVYCISMFLNYLEA